MNREKTIQRGNVNSFFADSEREVFTHRAIIDTSGKDYGKTTTAPD